MEYDAVIFDNDGVLVEPTDLDVLRDAAREAFADVGVTDPDPDHVEEVILGVTVGKVSAVCNTYGVEVDEFWPARDHAASRAQRAEISAGRKDRYPDVAVLDALDVPLGIVSTNQQATIEYVLDHFGWRDRFGTAYGRPPVVESLSLKKPDPHYVRRAMADLGARDPLFVGDSESDVEAAANAGVDSAFVRRPHRQEYPLGVEPTYEFESLDGLGRVVG